MSDLACSVRNAHDFVTEACGRIAASWNQERSESAMNLMDAFELLHCALGELDRAIDPGKVRREVEEIRDDAIRVQRDAEALIDDEPSAGDTREAEDVVGLARALQSKSRGASP